MKGQKILLSCSKKLYLMSFPLLVSVGYYSNIYLLTDHFLDLYRQSSAYRKQAAMVLNEIIRGAVGSSVADDQSVEGERRRRFTSQDDLKGAVVCVMEEYTSLRNWHLITVSEETDRDRQDQEVTIILQHSGFSLHEGFTFGGLYYVVTNLIWEHEDGTCCISHC